MALMVAINRLVRQGSQFIIATHSPISLAYPGANIYELSSSGLEKTSYEDIEHVNITKDFLNNPSSYLDRLFDK
jgi:predicted ATPase